MTDEELRKQVEDILEDECKCYGPLIITHDDFSNSDRFVLGYSVHFELFLDNKSFIYGTDSENYGGPKFNKQQFGWIIKQLQKLYEMMDE